MKNYKIAIVLYNLGGPDKLSSVRSFLFNLFYDKAIIKLPNPIRWIVAKFISIKREKYSQEIYKKIGGKSPILDITKKQADLLENKLNKENIYSYKTFVSMRYWHPFAKNVVKEVEVFLPDKIVLVPLYPQYSITTTRSSIDEFEKLFNNSFLKNIPRKNICCYFKNKNFIKAHVDLIKDSIKNIEGKFKILFSAHGLPEYVIKSGDPYQWQVEQTVLNILKVLGDDINHVVCYQSKVGRLKWIGPSTEEELIKAAAENVSVVVVPIAFVSEHSETLVELDIDYKNLFKNMSNKSYVRVPALNENENYILSLIDQIKLEEVEKCPKDFCKCFKESKNG